MTHLNGETPEQNAARLAAALADEERWVGGDDRVVAGFTPEERKAQFIEGWILSLAGQSVMALEVEAD